MTLFVPLGLLGLLSILVLIIIYIIKPNYAQKQISSTYVWKLSLKYRKRRIPISKLRNILIIVCQILILASLAFVLSQPNQITKAQIDHAQVIAIIDASASMRAQTNGETRFERAIDGVINDFNKLPSDGEMFVIFANAEPYFLLEGIKQENRSLMIQTLDGLLDNDMCSYGSADINKALALCDDLLSENPNMQVILYTGTMYRHVPEGIRIVNVGYTNEWNAAILNAYAEVEDNYFVFYVDIACYGRDEEIELTLEVQNANTSGSSAGGSFFSFSTMAECRQDITRTIIFKYFKQGEGIPDLDENSQYYFIENHQRIFLYQSVFISIKADDSFAQDNIFNIYGGQKETLRVQYSSENPNPFISSILGIVRGDYENLWDIQITETTHQSYQTEGFDFYIFEHSMPGVIPVDGVVFLINPNAAPRELGIRINGVADFRPRRVSLTPEAAHPITFGINAGNIDVSRYVRITDYGSFIPLLACNNEPVLLVKNEEREKIVIMSFSLHYSNLAISAEFVPMIFNIFDYFFPPTVKGNAFETYSKIALNSRGPELSVEYSGKISINETFHFFPSTLTVGMPGTYSLMQTTYFDKSITEQIYVKIPAVESNIWAIKDTLPALNIMQNESDYFRDLLVFVAAFLVAFLFIEWWLHNRQES